MIDESAIKALRQDSSAEAMAAAAANIVKALDDGHGMAAIGTGMNVQNLAHLLPNARRYSGTYSAVRVSDFCVYCRNQPEAFITVSGPTAEAVFDLGNLDAPGFAVHRASLALPQTGPYRSLLQFIATSKNFALAQREFAEFGEEWGNVISFHTADGSQMALNKAIAAIRNMTVNKNAQQSSNVGNVSAQRSALESVMVEKADDFPAYLGFNCTPYLGFKQRLLQVRIAVRIEDVAKPLFKLQLMRELELEDELNEELMAAIGMSMMGLEETHKVLGGSMAVKRS